MSMAIWTAGAFSIVATASHVGSVLIAIGRCRKGRESASARVPSRRLALRRLSRRVSANLVRRHSRPRAERREPGVSIVRPVCGIENYGTETLRSTFHLDYPNYEIIFC